MDHAHRTEWLAARRKGIGSSDAAAACGLKSFGRTPLHVYLDKCGLLPDETSEPMRWGLKLEEAVALAYEETTGRQLATPAGLYHHDSFDWLIATPDRLTAAHDRIVELKTARTAEGWGEPGSDEIPENYLTQCMHQAAVLQVDLVDVAVLIGGQDFRVYTVPANQDFIKTMVAIEAELWSKIVARTPPEPDWTHPDTPKLLDLLHRPVEGTTVEIDDRESITLVEHYQMACEFIREHEDFKAQAKARLIARMGEASIGQLPDGRRIKRRTVEPKVIAEHTRSGYVDMRILQPRVSKSQKGEAS